jgi:putative nucleotidyltransferase with HDIG domain
MSFDAICVAERTRDSKSQRTRAMEPELRRAEIAGALAFLACSGVLLGLGSGGTHFDLADAAIYVLAVAVASHVRFDVGAGFTVPIQAVFVPMLFALPTAAVPLLVVLGVALGMLPDVVRRRMDPSWLLTAPGNSWFALGPALVLTLAGDHSPVSQLDVLLAALAAQFLFDFTAAAVRDRLFDKELSPAELLREAAPIYAIDVALSALGLVVAIASASGYGEWPVVLIAPLFLVLRTFSKERESRLEQLVELNDAYQGTALLLGEVVEADDSYTGEHSKSVVRLAVDVAEEMAIGTALTRNVEFGALLHDVGKITVPNEIINKPGKLTDREWEVVKTHTIEGQKMLEKIGGVMVDIGRIVRASHEDWDGNGYPDGLAGEEIPIEARIVAACDAFNAMTTTRSYRAAMSTAAARAEMERCAGSQFDPEVVRALLTVTERSADTIGPEAALAPLDSQASPDHPFPGPSPSRDLDEGASWTSSGRTRELTTALAELAVTVGANIQPGQLVEVTGEIGHLELVRAIVRAAYDRGATYVDVQVVDPVVERLRVGAAATADLARVPPWQRERVRELTERGGASILVAGPTFPGLLEGFDPRAVAAAGIGPSAEWRDAGRAINWTIVAGATEGWANRLRPQMAKDEALTQLWSDLAHVCRLDEPDPTAAWRERLAVLRGRAAWLTELELDTVRFQGPGTDLTIGLKAGVRWGSAEMTAADGVRFLPNLPTEEIYTTPDPQRVEGHVRLTRPVTIGGTQIDDVVLIFRKGRIADVVGPVETRALWEFIERDPGTGRLGELALVDRESRVADLDRTFGETLLDENAACHIALGYGFPALLPASDRNATNDSDHHLDVMVGGPQVQVWGGDRRGRTHLLLDHGRWMGGTRRTPEIVQDAAVEMGDPPVLLPRDSAARGSISA